MEARRKVFDHLAALGISYQLSEHPAVYTIDEMENLGLDQPGIIVKNLFLRDAKGRRHFLIMIRQDKKVDLKSLREKIGSTSLQFASEERLAKYLGLGKGAVGPFGVLNDADRAVEVIFDRDLRGPGLLGVHPNDNTATVWLSFNDLERAVRADGREITYLEF